MRDDADQARQAHRAAAADEDAAAPFRQRVIGRSLGDADVRRGRKLEPAADDRAMQHGNHRHLAELDLLEGAVPVARMLDAFGDVALGQLVEIESGGEMIALAVQHHGLDVLRQCLEERLEAVHRLSSSALRFCGRDSRRIAISPRSSAVSEDRQLRLPSDALSWIGFFGMHMVSRCLVV